MNKFDLKPFDKVLVRAEKENHWEIDFFGRIDEKHEHHYIGTAGCCYVECIPYNDETAHLLGTADPYEEPYEPKDGDFVYLETYNNGKWLFIKKHGENKTNRYLSLELEEYEIYDCDVRPYIIEDHGVKFIRPATEEEKQLLLDKLHKEGKDWDADKKEVVNWKWKPKKGEDYWALDFSCDGFEETDNTWDNDEVDNGFLEKGLVFKTREEAAVKVKELNEKLFGKENKL